MVKEFQGQYRFLSNFWEALVQLDGQVYTSVEHAYQAAKSHDVHYRLSVLCARTAGDAKRLGRKVALRPDWEDVKVDIMLGLLRQKFTEPKLARLLLATGEQELVEGNYWGDTFWGVCQGKGKNQLGKLLMQVRQEIMQPLVGSRI